MDKLPDLERLSDQEKDALIVALWAEVQRLQTRLAELEAKLQEPVKDAQEFQCAALANAQSQHPHPPTAGDTSRGQCRSCRWVDAPCTLTPTR